MSNDKIDLFFVQDSNLISIPNDNPQTGLQTTILSLPISTTGQPIKLDSMCSVQMIVDNLSDPVSYAIRYFLFRDNIQLVQT
ncbi:hypothetical protein CN689_26405 [Peribacillus butanolivorans]|uniref:Uncharacterized protein n=1 Tax=Peribacillus butanolivorans TaxID=421767 RepID=A0AAX0RUX2_9BACI|nr:hypothetical protein [Peribacillus butanolivorans]PEJ25044.1 hypothetical protein CN689_26405 [Peribacillus butanolivorans]